MSKEEAKPSLETTTFSHPENSITEVPQASLPSLSCNVCFQKRKEFTLYEFPPPTENYVEREEIVQEIQNSVESCKNEKHPYGRLVVLYGFGGMGKSELAKLWAKKFHKDYNYVLWFDAESESKLLDGFKALAFKLKIKFDDQEDLSMVYRVLAEKCNNGVFIFDNAQRLTDHQGEFGIQPYLYFHVLPRKPTVIVTSRKGGTFWGSLSDRIETIHICISEEEFRRYDPRLYLPEWKGIVQAAFAPTVESMLLETDGSLGKELLDIITILGPNPVHAELLNAIYNKLPNSSSLAYEDFSWSDLATPVKKGLKLLQSYSLIEVTTRTETDYYCERNVQIISMHPFIQKHSLYQMRMTGNIIEVAEVVCKFFEQNERNENYCGQIKAVFEHLATEQFGKDALQNSVMMLCRLMLEGKLSECNGAEYLHRLQVWADDYSHKQVIFCSILRIVNFYASQVVPGEASEDACTKVAASIYQLGDQFCSHPWIFFSCAYVLSQMLPSFSPTELTLKANTTMRELADLMLGSWTKLLPRSYRYCPILCALRFSSRSSKWSADFISEVVGVTNEDDRAEFCQDLNKLMTFFNESKEGSWFIKAVLQSIGEDLLTRMLTFKEKRSKMKFLENFGVYSKCFNNIRTISSCSLAESRELTAAVWKYTEFCFDLITTNPYNWDVETLKICDSNVSLVTKVVGSFHLNPDHPEFRKKDLVSQCQNWLTNITLRRKDLSVGQASQHWLAFIFCLQGDVQNLMSEDESLRSEENAKLQYFQGKKTFHEFPPVSEFFCGREEMLREVEESIMDCEKETACDRRIVAIIGLGGMGKSEIAKQLAKRLQPKYDFIFWFNAQIRTAPDSEFKRLAAILKIPLPSEDSAVSILPYVYHCLAENYRKAIFIFDNAEQLKAGQGTFGLEEYMMPNLPCKKPVFLITSRYPWESVHQTIRCIRLQRLKDEDSYKCLLKYLHVEDHLQDLPTSLKNTIASLARRLEGIPLLLSLFGRTVADKANMISLDTMKSRVRSYIKLLEGQSLDVITEESKYEERLQTILRSTVLNMGTTSEGKIAVELLNIIALLSPDSIQAGLVNGIYCGKLFYPHEKFCLRFVWEDLETSVSMGLKILMKMSLIKVERKTYKYYDNLFEFDMIKVHRIIQKSTQNLRISGDQSVAPLEKIMRYCERNELRDDHIRFLLEFLIQKDLCHLETGWLLLLSSQLQFGLESNVGDRELFWKVKDFLRSKEVDPDSDKILCVLEIMMKEPRDNKEAWRKAKALLLELTPGFTKRRWVFQLSCKVVTYFYRRILQDGDDADFCDWFVKNWKECKEDYNPDVKVLMCLFRCDSNRDWSKDRELISKLIPRFTSEQEISRWDFWEIIRSFIRDCKAKQRIQLLELLVNGTEGNVFASSLQFSQDSSKTCFLERWAKYFCDCIIEVAKFEELRSSLLGNERFVDSFWDITSFTLKDPSAFRREERWREKPEVALIGTWCFLFHQDLAVYKCFGKKMDSEMQDFLHQRRPSDPATAPRNWHKYHEYLDYIRDFAYAKHCSEPTRNWIQEILK